jgi:hypothetical protein
VWREPHWTKEPELFLKRACTGERIGSKIQV